MAATKHAAQWVPRGSAGDGSQSMIRKSAKRFSEKIMLKQRAKRETIHPNLIAL
jgi:hypothetical protein